MSEQNGTSPPPAEPETGPVQSAEPETAAPAAPEPEGASDGLKRVNAALAAFAKACKNAAEQNYAVGGTALAYADTLVSVTAAAKFDTALANLADKAAEWSEDTLTLPTATVKARLRDSIGRKLRISAVVRCLTGSTDAPRITGKGKGKGGTVPWGQAREMLPVLSEGERGAFFVAENIREKAAHLWEEVCTGSMRREDIGAAAAELDKESKAAAAEEARQDKERKAAAQRAADKIAADAKAAEDKAAAVKEAADKAAAIATGPEKVNLTAQAETAREQLADAQQTAAVAVDDAANKAAAVALAEQEEKNRVNAKVEADAKAKAKKDAADKAKREKEGKNDTTPPAAPPATTPPAAPPAGGVTVKAGAPVTNDPRQPEPASGNVFANLAKMAKRGAAKDVAEGIAAAIRASDDSAALLCETLSCFTTDDSALTSLLMALESSANISAKGKRAVAAALGVLAHKGRGGVDPAVNGAPATAGAA